MNQQPILAYMTFAKNGNIRMWSRNEATFNGTDMQPIPLCAARELTEEEQRVTRAAMTDTAEVVHPGKIFDLPVDHAKVFKRAVKKVSDSMARSKK